MPVDTTLRYDTLLPSSFGALPASVGSIALLGKRALLRASPYAAALGLNPETWAAMLADANPGDAGGIATTYLGDRLLLAGAIPDLCSRHNSPARADALPPLARRIRGNRDAVIVVHIEDASQALPMALALGRAFPLFSEATSPRLAREVRVCIVGPQGIIDEPGLRLATEASRFAGRLVDAPPDALHTSAFVAEAEAVGAQLGVPVEVLQGERLREEGYGGLWNVGRAAPHPPALVTLRYQPTGATRHVAWVGKGIVYDTGGHSLKTKEGMPGMKGDMAGAAAVLAAFSVAVQMQVPYAITAVLCLAENSIGPTAIRPDDILTMRSGKTVEVNNTDAEGRLVLADGVAHAAAGKPDLIVDIATLTGAVLASSGKVHAGIVSNDEAVEQAALQVGRRVGEPCHALLWAPELLRREFKSAVADMKNSVKDRNNAQSSCAAWFIAAHLPDPAQPWLHVDIAGTAWDAERRGTGAGIGLLLGLGAGPLRSGG